MWTGPSPFGDRSIEVVATWGLSVRVVASADEVFEVAARLVRGVGALFGADDDSYGMVSTWEGADTELAAGEITGLSLRRIVGTAHFQAVSVGRTHVTVGERSSAGDHLLEATFRVQRDEQDPDILDAVLERAARKLISEFSVLFLGAESTDIFDRRETQMAPSRRVALSTDGDVNRVLAPGYYWITALNMALASALDEPPAQLEDCHEVLADRNGVTVHWYKLADSSMDETTIRARIPALRWWLKPILQSWIVKRGTMHEQRFYEGPAVASATAEGIAAWEEERSWVRVLASQPAETRAIANWVPLDTAPKLRWSFVADAADHETVHAAVGAAATAVQRTLAEEWLGPLGSIEWTLEVPEPGQYELHTRAEGQIRPINEILWCALSGLKDHFLLHDQGMNGPRRPIHEFALREFGAHHYAGPP
jgi:hypothetical protein